MAAAAAARQYSARGAAGRAGAGRLRCTRRVAVCPHASRCLCKLDASELALSYNGTGAPGRGGVPARGVRRSTRRHARHPRAVGDKGGGRYGTIRGGAGGGAPRGGSVQSAARSGGGGKGWRGEKTALAARVAARAGGAISACVHVKAVGLFLLGTARRPHPVRGQRRRPAQRRAGARAKGRAASSCVRAPRARAQGTVSARKKGPAARPGQPQPRVNARRSLKRPAGSQLGGGRSYRAQRDRARTK